MDSQTIDPFTIDTLTSSFTTTYDPSTNDNDSISWPTIASITYFSLYVLLVIILSIYIHRTEEYDSKKDFLKAVWSRRGIYGQILVHLYDTATDIGVLIQWGTLAYDETDYESIDMRIMFWTSIGFLIFYRILSWLFSMLQWNQDDDYEEEFYIRVSKCCIDCSLGCCDMYIIKTVYKSLKYGHEEPTPQQKAVQLMESIFESLPQVVLQSVFIIRSNNDVRLRENSSIMLVAASLVASLFSISNKYTWLDRDGVEEKAQDAEFKRRYPCINGWYVVRIVWRFSFVATRFAILSLAWSVLGGAILGIFLAISFCVWFFTGAVLLGDENADWCEHLIVGFAWGIPSLISTPTSEYKTTACVHASEMIVALILISIFAYNEFDCGICANAHDRQANNNPYIEMFIIAGWSTMVVDFIAYGILLYGNIFKENAFKSIKLFFDGFGGKMDEK